MNRYLLQEELVMEPLEPSFALLDATTTKW
jgi:hypothetical protein